MSRKKTLIDSLRGIDTLISPGRPISLLVNPNVVYVLKKILKKKHNMKLFDSVKANKMNTLNVLVKRRLIHYIWNWYDL